MNPLYPWHRRSPAVCPDCGRRLTDDWGLCRRCAPVDWELDRQYEEQESIRQVNRELERWTY